MAPALTSPDSRPATTPLTPSIRRSWPPGTPSSRCTGCSPRPVGLAARDRSVAPPARTGADPSAAQHDVQGAGVGGAGEDVVGLLEVVEAEPVRNELAGVKLASGDQPQEHRRRVRIHQSGANGDVPDPLI